MEYKINDDCKFRDREFEKGKKYKLTPKEYRCLKEMGVLALPKKSTKKTSIEENINK
tara:strand:- start:26 stop:196 length:171 start_codon:yes stop_codon:yes gene_type:complete